MIGAWGIRLQGLRLKGLAHFSLDLDVDGLMVVEWVRGVCALVSGHSQMKIPVGVHGSEIYKVASQDAWQDHIRTQMPKLWADKGLQITLQGSYTGQGFLDLHAIGAVTIGSGVRVDFELPTP